MAAWRMAMRGRFDEDENWADPPDEMWPECHRLRVAAITYGPIRDVDFGKYAQPDRAPGFADLAPARKQSLRRFVRKMQVGDVIYVKQGPQIVGKGIVEEDYQFDLEVELSEVGWGHWSRVELVSRLPASTHPDW